METEMRTFIVLPMMLALVSGAQAQLKESRSTLYTDYRGITPFKETPTRYSLTEKTATEPSLNLEFNHLKKCGDLSIDIWGIARHLGTDHKFNERNGGVGGKYFWCSLPEGMYLTFFRVKNSLSGLTYGVGTGFESEVLRVNFFKHSFRLGVGIDTNYLNYGVPEMCNTSGKCRQGFTVRGALPMGFISLGTDRVQLVVHRLVPTQKIYLFGIQIKM